MTSLDAIRAAAETMLRAAGTSKVPPLVMVEAEVILCLLDVVQCAVEWCDSVDHEASWDGWDHHYKRMKYKLLPQLGQK